MPFSDLPLHPSVAAALAARGYTTATPVQAAVLAPALAGKDLLVSAPTGSGKTVAFGTLIADTLLASEAARAAPRALVVAPTRELANQVSQELGWLLAGGRLAVGAFTGGTSVAADLRRLRGGLAVVVGTPGRLVDLHERGALDLSGIEALVLDEADEMLDLGFREALEYLLGKAPAERRTLLFSATLPPDITRMAATYQRDAIRVDPREKGTASPHADIEHVAHLTRREDRLATVVNVLLAAGGGKAIVFCRTREGVGELHQRLVDHGFRAAAISGDRAQGDRDRALGALRAGRARILVATNVAARGLDLPDVELVLHADLPDNAESLTHRSGRTGRAGRKGRSVVIAELRERRKAERLLHAARAQVRFTPAPTAEDVRRSLVDGLRGELLASINGSGGDGEGAGPPPSPSPETEELADRLRAALPERVLIAALLERELARLPKAMRLEPIGPDARAVRASAPTLERGARVGRGPGAEREGTGWREAVLFRVNLGANAKAEPGWLLPLICRRGGVTRREVGAIRVGPQSSTFEIAADAAADFAMAAAESDPRAPHVTIEPVAGAPRSEGRTEARTEDRPRAAHAKRSLPPGKGRREAHERPAEGAGDAAAETPTGGRRAAPATSGRDAAPATASFHVAAEDVGEAIVDESRAPRETRDRVGAPAVSAERPSGPAPGAEPAHARRPEPSPSAQAPAGRVRNAHGASPDVAGSASTRVASEPPARPPLAARNAHGAGPHPSPATSVSAETPARPQGAPAGRSGAHGQPPPAPRSAADEMAEGIGLLLATTPPADAAPPARDERPLPYFAAQALKGAKPPPRGPVPPEARIARKQGGQAPLRIDRGPRRFPPEAAAAPPAPPPARDQRPQGGYGPLRTDRGPRPFPSGPRPPHAPAPGMRGPRPAAPAPRFGGPRDHGPADRPNRERGPGGRDHGPPNRGPRPATARDRGAPFSPRSGPKARPSGHSGDPPRRGRPRSP